MIPGTISAHLIRSVNSSIPVDQVHQLDAVDIFHPITPPSHHPIGFHGSISAIVSSSQFSAPMAFLIRSRMVWAASVSSSF